MLLTSLQLHHIFDALVRKDSSTMFHRKDLVVDARGSSRKRWGLIGRGSGEDVQLQPPRNDQRGTLVYYQRHVTYLIATVVIKSPSSLMKAHSKHQKGTCL